MTVKFKNFISGSASWDSLCKQASEFASSIGKDRVISISVSSSGGTLHFGGIGAEGIVTVWYWDVQP